MKHFYILSLVLFSFIIFTGCQRPETEPSSLKNTLIPISSTAKTTSSYLISAQIGHDGSKCPGCVLENGKYIHVNCQGDGTCCSIAAAVLKTNKHLPDVPSAEEVEQGGVDLGEMNAVLLQKIEEMTLYIIDLQKQIDELKTKGGE